MYSDWVGPAVAGFLAVWLTVLSILVWQQHKFLKSLFPKSGSRDIRKKFEEVIKAVDDFKKGDTKALNFLLGAVMQLSEKRADFSVARKILEKKLVN